MENARIEGEKLIENAKISGKELIRAMSAGSKEDAQAEIAKLRTEDERSLSALVDAAGRNKEKALELIIRTFRQGP
jgi:hypothetical protein